ncbi:hypothetical protein [Nostoc sp. TCL26-01]|uniref:hypothetical protein n=1 Tax=Nostoc sp. TCL26-01 TaxID=2576904 RepID=UPI0015C026D5|nr:hypothetical protein [Nostoc sp. TCL26-01]QLE54175.1 hypothetical protein FD725_00700 [Nostoc sp. TCL26-01]
MNPQPEDDLQRRLQQLEAQMNAQHSETEQNPQTSRLNFPAHVQKWQLWFNGLSGTNKLIISGVAVLLGITIAQMVMKLVTLVISLALLAGLVYLGYKFFLSGNWKNQQ